MHIYEYGFVEQDRIYRRGRTEYEYKFHKEDNGTRIPVRRISQVISTMGEDSEQYKHILGQWINWRSKWDLEELGAVRLGDGGQSYGGRFYNRPAMRDFFKRDKR